MAFKWQVGQILRTTRKITRVDGKSMPKGTIIKITARNWGMGYNIISVGAPELVVTGAAGRDFEVI